MPQTPSVNATVAWLDAAGDPNAVAGCAFLVRSDLALTCAHVVRDHLGLGRPTPAAAPQQVVRLRFPALRWEVEARVAGGGWFPDTHDPDADGPGDIAVLRLSKPRFNVPCAAPAPTPPDHGEKCRIMGCVSGYQNVGQSVHATIDADLGWAGWHQFQFGSDNERTYVVTGGFSGAPVFDERSRAVLGMVAVKDERGHRVAFAIPASDLRRAVMEVERRAYGPGGAARRQRDDTARLLRAEAPAHQAPKLLALAREQTDRLREQVERAANQMPTNFGRHAVCARLGSLAILLRRKRIRPADLGLQAMFFTDLVLAIDALPADDRPELDALVPLAAELLGALAAGRTAPPTLEADPAPWPPETRQAVRAQLDGIEAALDEVEAPEAAEQVEAARYHTGMLRSEVERDAPDWPVVRHEAAALEGCLRGEGEEDSALAGVRRSARDLSATLRDIAEAVVRGLPPLATFQDLSWAPVMVVIPAGRFLMGSAEDEEVWFGHERPQHEVRIGSAFALGRYPVTFDEYDAFCMATRREMPGDRDWGRGRRPVINVSREDVQAYMAWLGTRTGHSYRLPSEAEWEHACRAGTTTPYWWSDAISPERANYGNKVGHTTVVGSYPANPRNLFDMLGNVLEWVEDPWHESYEHAPNNGSAWRTGGDGGDPAGVSRGGSWFNVAGNVRSASRSRRWLDDRDEMLGFRVARALPS